MEQLNRGDKIYLDKENKEESAINSYLDCRDGVVEAYEYRDESGYGSKTRLFLCRNNKHESLALIRQVWNESDEKWREEVLFFDSDSFLFLEALINGREEQFGGEYTLVRTY